MSRISSIHGGGPSDLPSPRSHWWAYGPPGARQGRQKWLVPASLVVAGLLIYALNFKMSADRMFLEPASVTMRPVGRNSVEPNRLVVGVEINGDARAYPLRFIGYHHQVRDTIGGKPVMVSYCTVCRTGRVFSPLVDGRPEKFRLVGMDHFNAMFEDNTTGSWWRQATGQAIVGRMKGKVLEEIPSQQVTLAEWLSLHPNSLIMQPDSTQKDEYAKGFDYETGRKSEDAHRHRHHLLARQGVGRRHSGERGKQSLRLESSPPRRRRERRSRRKADRAGARIRPRELLRLRASGLQHTLHPSSRFARHYWPVIRAQRQE